MGKKSGKNKKHEGSKPYDNDTIVFISMAQEHKHDGNKLFQKKNYESAILKFEKALKLLPGNHIDVSYLHSSIASCYMQMGVTEFPRAIHECDLALEVTPKYSKALVKRARCYEALNRLDFALRDVNLVLDIEPKNLMAIEISNRVKAIMEKKPIEEEKENVMEMEIFNWVFEEKSGKSMKEKIQKKKGEKLNKNDDNVKKFERKKGENRVKFDKKETEDKLVVEEKISVFTKENECKKSIKLVFEDDIRWAKIPFNCDILQLREIVHDRFPLSRAVLMKYRDQEGDLMTIMTNEDLRWAESSISYQNGSVKLHIVEVNPEQDPFFGHIRRQEQNRKLMNSSSCIDEWILEFARLFKNYVGFNSDSCFDLHEIGMNLYTEAMEDTITSEEAQELFEKAAEKFQEMAALALFNWGNVHISKARKRVYFTENGSRESVFLQLEDSFEWAQSEYSKAGDRYEKALNFKPDFYEGVLALAHQQFEKAKLSWCYAIGLNLDLEKWDSRDVIKLYNKAEDNMEKGMKMWEKERAKMVNIRKDGVENMRSQINVLWGTILYERSIMEYRIGVPVWHECLEIAVEKFELAGVSRTDIAVMVKNHCSNDAAPEGLGFDIDEIIQAWNDMYEAKRWQSGVRSFRLEPLLRRRSSKLFYALKNAS